MSEVIQGHLYDYPEYYDLVFASDWKAEFRFLEACFRRYAGRPVRRLFEPACGTGRLMIRFAEAGYEVAGNDLNAHAIEFCNRRLREAGYPATAVVGDMADFRLRRKVDAAFNTINSFRHLGDEATAESHLRCVARALGKGGLYVLGLHLTPADGEPSDTERWRARRGQLRVQSKMWSISIDLRRRQERVGMTFDVRDGERKFRLAEEMIFRTYTYRQMRRLLGRVEEFETVATFDFGYDINDPIEVGPDSEDVIYVLRRR